MNGLIQTMKTHKLFYEDQYLREFDSVVVSVKQFKDSFRIVLKETAFYPEGGGQPGDTGFINNTPVFDTTTIDDEIVHLCKNEIPVNTKVHCIIDWEKRFDLMQQHSGEHIFSGIACGMFNCNNVGFHLGSDCVTVDYDKYIDPENIINIEKQANDYIMQNHPCEIMVFDDENETSGIEYRSKKEINGELRIVSFPGADTCACCGTHVRSSSEIGLIKVIGTKKFHSGVRIDLLCGKRALNYLMTVCEQNTLISRELSSNYADTFNSVFKLKTNINDYKKKITELENELFDLIADKYYNKGVTVLFRETMDFSSLIHLCDRVFHSCKDSCVIFSGNDNDEKVKYVIRADDLYLSTIVSNLNLLLNGRGGGRDGLAQGSVSANMHTIKAKSENILTILRGATL